MADRVHTARRLAASGVSVREIALALGVSRSSIHNYLQARFCPECGGPVTNPTAERCAACAASRPTVSRGRSTLARKVRAAIHAWTAEHGRPPSHRDWTPARGDPGRWEADSPRWPTAAVVCDLYAEGPRSRGTLGIAARPRRRRRPAPPLDAADDSVQRGWLAEFWVAHGHRAGQAATSPAGTGAAPTRRPCGAAVTAA